MIRNLSLKDVGPARDMSFDFAPRLNLLTGDNGLGKTFVLDVLWWVLTSTWAGEMAFPRRPLSTPSDAVPRAAGSRTGAAPLDVVLPHIEADMATQRGQVPYTETAGVHVRASYRFDPTSQGWLLTPTDTSRAGSQGSPWPLTGEPVRVPQSLVIYARVDGRFALWDGYTALSQATSPDAAAIVLTADEVWNGKTTVDTGASSGRRTVIAGLISDWVRWQERSDSPEFALLMNVLEALSPPDEPLRPGRPTRVHLNDRRDIPTLDTTYGEVPVTLASAGFKRALSLAYLLVWAWTEHVKTAAVMGREPVNDVVLLLDEPELHLHPSWQRAILPAVLKAVDHVAPRAQVQLVTATHSPLVLASLESVFSEERDDLFVLERSGDLVRATELPFGKQGDVMNWLASEAFGRLGGRSREAELAIGAAMDFMAGRLAEAELKLGETYAQLRDLPAGDPVPAARNVPPGSAAAGGDPGGPLVDRVHEALKRTVAGHDEFWAQWTLVHRPGARTIRGKHATP